MSDDPVDERRQRVSADSNAPEYHQPKPGVQRFFELGILAALVQPWAGHEPVASGVPDREADVGAAQGKQAQLDDRPLAGALHRAW